MQRLPATASWHDEETENKCGFCHVQVRSQALLQDKFQHICAGFEGHVADMKAALTQIVCAAAAVLV